MKKMFLFVSAVLMVTAAHAQHGYGYSRTTDMNFVPNGYRTVAEENAEMERVVAERRKLAAKEEGIPYVPPKFEYYHEPKPVAKKPVATATTSTTTASTGKPVARAVKR